MRRSSELYPCNSSQRTLQCQFGVRKCIAFGNTTVVPQSLAVVPATGSFLLEPDSGCVQLVSGDGRYRLDANGDPIWFKTDKRKTAAYVMAMKGG